ncbi:sensor histidine kinase [Hyphococcus sp.]|uniref:sensor histidine kinase n=1 Tax=Hyphococcus sp. TaxID=2038636 RepID=UPI003CCBB628
MRALKPFSQSQGSLLADYASRMGEAIVRRRAELEARTARIEAEMAITARSEFLANMNHELRTPLNAIIGFATMLRESEDYELGEEQRDSYAQYILQSADLLLGHINTLLDVAALESGKVDVHDQAIECRALLEDAVSRVKVRAQAAEVDIEVLQADAEVIGWGDEQRLSQATDHILQTAIKLSRKGGRVMARAGITDKGWAEIAIRDEGKGLTKQELFEALEAFQQTLRGLDHSWVGPGVGYAIAKTFVEIQGGRFSIESRPDEGTLVQISLPPPGAEDAPDEDFGEDDFEIDLEDDDLSAEREDDAA